MTVAPARAAGVQDITVVCPRPAPAVLCAALEAGVTRVLRIGGAQAVAALAYGTESIARVDKIVGPGNAWVAAAKSLVSPDCAIDFHAGPSEIVVCADDGRPDWIAADLLAQAEHDPAARAILVTTRRVLAAAVAREVARQMPAAGPAREAIRRNGAIVITASRRESIALVNRLAPEHLVCDRAADVRRFNDRRHDLRRATGARRRRATTPPDRITCCRRAAPGDSAAASRPRTSCGSSPCKRSPAAASAQSAHPSSPSLTRRA